MKPQNPRIPATPKTRHVCSNVASHSKALKTLWRKSGRHESLKQFIVNSDSSDIKSLGSDWIHNKTSNFSKPPRGIGNTSKKKQQQRKKIVATTAE